MFHVYVDGPVEPGEAAIHRLADAIAAKYGLPAADLAARLAKGRVRVKANVDRGTAETYQRALVHVGARVTITDAHPTQVNAVATADASAVTPTTVRRSMTPSTSPQDASAVSASPGIRTPSPSTPPATQPRPPTAGVATGRSATVSVAGIPASAARTPATGAPTRTSSASLPAATIARPTSSSLPPATVARPSSSSLPPATARRTSTPPAGSGLSAAYSQGMPVADLGALDADGALALSSLDGNDAGASTGGSFGPPSTPSSPPLPASMGPAISGARPPASRPRPTDQPLDLFAPPDAESADARVDLAADEVEHRARRSQPLVISTATPAARTNSAPTTPPLSPPLRPKMSTAQPPTLGTTAVEPPLDRVRLAAGVAIAIILGFVPAHLVASWRESAAYKPIDAQVEATQTAADTPEMYAALDAFRDSQIARKKSERRSIALASMLIWGLAGGGLGYVWFRRIPWDRLKPAT